jgi:hypothetical protein
MTSATSTYSAMIRVQNSGSSSKNLWIEPWGDQIVMQPGDVFEIVANGPVGDCLEVASADSDIVIYGWPESTLSVLRSEKVLREYRIQAPPTPSRS